MNFFWLPLSIIRCNGFFYSHIHVWNRRSHSSSSMMVEAVGVVKAVVVVEVEVRRDDASGSDSTRFLSDKLDVDNFSKNIFRALHSDISCHDEL